MLRLRKKRGQSTAEYAILIGVVISAVIAMQVFIGEKLKTRMDQALNWDDPEMTSNPLTASIFTGNRIAPPGNITAETETTRYSPVRQEFLGGTGAGERGTQKRTIEETGEIITRTGNQRRTFP